MYLKTGSFRYMLSGDSLGDPLGPPLPGLTAQKFPAQPDSQPASQAYDRLVLSTLGLSGPFYVGLGERLARLCAKKTACPLSGQALLIPGHP